MEDRANILRQMKVCRFCLTNEEQNLINMHEELPQKSDTFIPLPCLSLQIMACIAIEVVRNDGMPQYICKTCRHLTMQAYIFKTNCKKADDALKLFLVTGQLSKPYIQAVEIKVQPTSEKYITIVKDEATPAVATNSSENSKVYEMDLEQEEESTDSTFIDENTTSFMPSKSQSVQQLETFSFPCHRCDRSFPLKQLLDLHMVKHSRERNFECFNCKSKFYSKYDLQKHMLTHSSDKEYSCIVCKKTFLRESFLRRHEKIHEDVPKYCCTQCDKSFLTKEYLDYHMDRHNKKRPFVCKVCQKSFVFKQGLERHEVVHSSNKPHKCNYCEASFISAIKLRRHITSHAGLRPYPCKLCNRTFLLSHHLTRHMRTHYFSNSVENVVGQYKCDICSMSFQKQDSLVNHSMIHSMVNLKCVICNTSFETAELVKEHIFTHLTCLPHACDKCDYSFETKEQLEEHELKHAEMEYEEQIEQEVFSETLDPSHSQESELRDVGEDNEEEEDEEEEEEDEEEEALEEGDDVEEGEVREYTIVDINNPEAGLKRTHEAPKHVLPKENNVPRLEFLKDEVESDEENEEAVAQDEESVENLYIKPIVRQEGTKVYQRKNIPPKKPSLDVRTSSLKPTTEIEKTPENPTLTSSIPSDANALSNKTMKFGEKIVKVKKFILTKDEMKAMAKQGILEIKGGQVVLKSGRSQQILNASLKPIQKNEIDSLLNKRSANRMQVKRYEKKTTLEGREENANT